MLEKILPSQDDAREQSEDLIKSAQEIRDLNTNEEDFDGGLDDPLLAESSVLLDKKLSNDELAQLITDLNQPEAIIRKAFSKLLQQNPTLDDLEYILKNSTDASIKTRVKDHIKRLSVNN